MIKMIEISIETGVTQCISLLLLKGKNIVLSQ